jgi:hypothetical protein
MLANARQSFFSVVGVEPSWTGWAFAMGSLQAREQQGLPGAYHYGQGGWQIKVYRDGRRADPGKRVWMENWGRRPRWWSASRSLDGGPMKPSRDRTTLADLTLGNLTMSFSEIMRISIRLVGQSTREALAIR